MNSRRLHPLQSILLGFPLVFFASVIVSDVAYLRTAEMQWSNFSAWLITGGLITGIVTLAWAICDVAQARHGENRKRLLLIAGLFGSMWIAGFFNVLLHSRDAWYSVTQSGLLLSVLTAALAAAAAWLFFTYADRGGRA